MISIEAGKIFIGWIELPLRYLKSLVKSLYRWIRGKIQGPVQIGSQDEGVKIYSYDPLKESQEPVFIEADPKFSSFIIIEKLKQESSNLPNRIVLNIKDVLKFLKSLKKTKENHPQTTQIM